MKISEVIEALKEIQSSQGDVDTVDGPVIVISEKEYESLKRDALFLDCLRAVGVDNWDGYGEAWREFRKAEEEEG